MPRGAGDLTSSIASNVEDLRGWQRALTSVVLQQAGGMGGENAVEKWCDTNRRDIARSGDMIAEFEAGDMDIGKLALANRYIRRLIIGYTRHQYVAGVEDDST